MNFDFLYIYIYREREREKKRGNVTFRLVLKQTLGILIGCNLKTQVDINVYLYCISCQTFIRWSIIYVALYLTN